MPSASPGSRHTVAAPAFDGIASFELGAVVEVFGSPAAAPRYDLRVCSPSHQDVLAAADTVVVTAVPDARAEVPPELVAALRDAHARGARVVSICSGVFALAAAGLLDGREATTHWQYTDLLRESYPRIRVRPGVLYVDGGDVLTGAGNAAALDLCLHLVRRDHGARVAGAIARHLVGPPHREGDQAQVVAAAVPEAAGGDGVSRAMAWALAHLAEPITVAGLAAQAHLAPRTFLRHFHRRTGTSPLRWVVAQRITASLPLLERGAQSVEQVGAAVGLDHPATFRYHFTRVMGTSPSAYRRTFRTTA
ncbi:GlxA family transcriptional regulator [Amycolatopsis sp. MEPSY49]|uniref:GlxA family transcriptional regulator n=1 Tax=Amycolatopsis sp. MEPSY49 TaxID=3151600 RepID=UPI003EF1AF9E